MSEYDYESYIETAAISALRARIAEIKIERDELLEECYELEAERDELRAERNGLQAECDELQAERDDLGAERDKLQSFKDYVHARLDAAGVPTHLGDRLDLVIRERNKYARALAHAWEYAAALRTISGQFFAVPPAPTIVLETAARASVLVAEIERGKDDG